MRGDSSRVLDKGQQCPEPIRVNHPELVEPSMTSGQRGPRGRLEESQSAINSKG